jgi:4-oxalocrotonate tautomerase
MPHVVVKMYSGRTEQDKERLAAEITAAVKAALKSADESISVAIEDIEPNDWTEQVYKPDILGKPKTIYKQPGYRPA